eukprot:CAMPEP_0178410496 /NCGR_PEP_ID=MMETSP0689_2-20121128/21008_1 /TAXON_ID=160604 /ORGANISM="Amphidinium massartii, Strain CS-259" /LENGTH=324 /DNA_ID=CAMNT_0020031671 /DNA_START=238 /DNA_END=1212 /DNA_ORIENTATION=+
MQYSMSSGSRKNVTTAASASAEAGGSNASEAEESLKAEGEAMGFGRSEALAMNVMLDKLLQAVHKHKQHPQVIYKALLQSGSSIADQVSGALVTRDNSMSVSILAIATAVAVLVGLAVWRCQSMEKRGLEEALPAKLAGPNDEDEVWIPRPRAAAGKAQQKQRQDDEGSRRQGAWPQPKKEEVAAQPAQITSGASGSSGWPAEFGSHQSAVGSSSALKSYPNLPVKPPANKDAAASSSSTRGKQSKHAKQAPPPQQDLSIREGIADRFRSMGKSVFKKSGAKDVYKAAKSGVQSVSDTIQDVREEVATDLKWAQYQSLRDSGGT